MMEVNITGPQGCGKTTLAELMQQVLYKKGKKVVILDEGKMPPSGKKEVPADTDVLITCSCEKGVFDDSSKKRR